MSRHNGTLYQNKILMLNKEPLNYKKLADAGFQEEISNPLCGDVVEIYAQVTNQNEPEFEQICFYGESCAITKASASLMTSIAQGKSLRAVKNIAENFAKMLEGREEEQSDTNLGELSIFNEVKNYPARKSCALLPWQGLLKLLSRESQNVI